MVHNILYLVDMLSTEGGGTNQYEGLFRSLDPQRFRPHVWCEQDTKFVERVRKTGIPVIQRPLAQADFDQRNPLRVLRKHWFCARSIREVTHYARTHQISLVHGDHHKGYLISALTRQLGIPSIYHIRCELFADKLRLEPFDTATRVLVISERLKRPLLDGGVAAEKIQKISDAVDTEKFHPRTPKSFQLCPDKNKNKDLILVGLVGRVVVHKRVAEFLEVVKNIAPHIPQARFLVIGSRPDTAYFEKMESYVRQAGIRSQVLFVDEQTDMPAIYNELDIVVNLAGGSVLMEAMACSKPLVATAKFSPVQHRIVKDGENGFLHDYSDFVGLGKSIIRLVRDPIARSQMGLNGWKYASTTFSLQRITRLMEASYEELLQRSHSQAA